MFTKTRTCRLFLAALATASAALLYPYLPGIWQSLRDVTLWH